MRKKRSDMARDPGVPRKLFSGSQKGPWNRVFNFFQIHISMFLIVSRLNLMEYESSVLVLILNLSTASVLVLRRSRQRAESNCLGLPSEMPCSAVQNQAHTGDRPVRPDWTVVRQETPQWKRGIPRELWDSHVWFPKAECEAVGCGSVPQDPGAAGANLRTPRSCRGSMSP